MASTDNLTIDIEGVGGHAARPHLAVDPILVGAQIVNQLQSIVSRNVDPLDAAVVSICVFQAGSADNIIPQTARLRGTVRSLRPRGPRPPGQAAARSGRGDRARSYGATAKVDLRRGYPVLRNHERETAFAASIAEPDRRA